MKQSTFHRSIAQWMFTVVLVAASVTHPAQAQWVPSDKLIVGGQGTAFSTKKPGTGSSFGEWLSDLDRPLAWRGLGWTAADWTDLGSSDRWAHVAQAASPAGTETPDRCAELTKDFTISTSSTGAFLVRRSGASA